MACSWQKLPKGSWHWQLLPHKHWLSHLMSKHIFQEQAFNIHSTLFYRTEFLLNLWAAYFFKGAKERITRTLITAESDSQCKEITQALNYNAAWEKRGCLRLPVMEIPCFLQKSQDITTHSQGSFLIFVVSVLRLALSNMSQGF